MAERHEQAWVIPWTPEIEGVLVRCSSGPSVWWWVLCPAAATLHIDTVDGGEGSCSEGCDFPEVHEAAAVLWEEVRDA